MKKRNLAAGSALAVAGLLMFGGNAAFAATGSFGDIAPVAGVETTIETPAAGTSFPVLNQFTKTPSDVYDMIDTVVFALDPSGPLTFADQYANIPGVSEPIANAVLGGESSTSGTAVSFAEPETSPTDCVISENRKQMECQGPEWVGFPVNYYKLFPNVEVADNVKPGSWNVMASLFSGSQEVTQVTTVNVTGYGNSVTAPNVGDQQISGTGTPGETIEIRDDSGDVVSSTVVDENGDWTVTAPDESGNYVVDFDGEQGAEFEYDRGSDATEDDFALVSPAPGSQIQTEDQVFSGTGEPGSEFVITDADGTVIASGVVDQDGTWSVTAETIAEGPVELTVTVTTADGEELPGKSLGTFLATSDAGQGSPLVEPIMAGAAAVLALGAGAFALNRRRKIAAA